MKRLLTLLLLCSAMVFGQARNTANLSGVVNDPQGAAVPAAQVEVVNVDTGASLKTTTDERGEWIALALPAGNYRVTVTAAGFKKATTDGVLMNAGVPKAVNTALEIGAATETVEVVGGAELVQTSSATLSTTVQTRQVLELPYITRAGMDLFITQPGVQTTGANRNSYINGLPLNAINVTIDGINTQDNYYRNGDGFFTVIPARQDSLEEITLTTSAGNADANAQGAATVRFVTKSGTNSYHGSVFEQHRDTWFNANSYFNNINGQPRNRQVINQFGGNIGGPIIKNKLVFFTNLELFRYPATSSLSRVVMLPADMNGNYTYPISGGTRTVNVLQMAGANGFPTAIDPIIKNTLNQIQGYTANGTLQDRIASNSDYNRDNLLFSPKGYSNYWTDTSRLDYMISPKHTLSLSYTYYKLTGKGDVTNNVFNQFPGTGAVVGLDDLFVSQSGNRYALAASLRSSLTPTITNEFRFGFNRAISLFRPEVSSPAQFNEWRGYAPTLGFSLSGVASVTSSSRRASPVKELHDTVAMQKGTHTLSFGGDVTRIDLWYVTVGSSVIPSIAFGAATNDPIVTGATNLFTTTSMPGSTSTYQGEAAALYSLLTGRVSSITRSVAYDGQSYKAVPPVDRDRQYEWGIFAQDSWRVSPSLTVNYGLRFEQQRPFQNLDQAYSSVSYASLWGISGIGNMFQPGGPMNGTVPTFDKYNSNYYKSPTSFNPSAGIAWQLPGSDGLLGLLFGKERGQSVLRAGYAINSVRNGSYTFQAMTGANTGITYDTSISPGTYPADFGAPGSVLFSQPNLPVRSGVPNAPAYPIAATLTTGLNGYDPNLKMPYVQSWNIGFQRQLSKNTVIEVRYTGNHGLKEWRQVNLNEFNVFENGFLKEFQVAQQNLFINRGCSGSWTNCTNPNSNSFANAGLAGEGPIPIISTALGTTTDANTATYLRQNRPYNVASAYSTNTTYYNRLIAAGYPKNMWVVNPTVASGGSYLLANMGSSVYDALQVELNRHMASGLLMQASYVWGKSLANGAGQTGSSNDLIDYNNPTTFRNLGLDKAPTGGDIRHAIKINGIYELPFGTGRKFLAGGNPVIRKIVEGWEISSIGRLQSGGPFQVTSGRAGMNGSEAGVVLNNMGVKQLQDMVQIRKITASNGLGQVMYLPDSLIANTNAAFEANGLTWSNLNTSQPYIGPQLAPGQFGYKVFLRNPWQYHWDASVMKRLTIHERFKVEFSANVMNLLNLTDFMVVPSTTASVSASGTSFGRTTTQYNDLTYNYDPGSRVMEFRLRIGF